MQLQRPVSNTGDEYSKWVQTLEFHLLCVKAVDKLPSPGHTSSISPHRVLLVATGNTSFDAGKMASTIVIIQIYKW